MAEHKEKEEEKPELDDEVSNKAELHDEVVKAEAEPDDEIQESKEDESKKEEHETHTTGKKSFNPKEFLATKKGKIIAAILAAAVVIGVVFAVPVTRYGVLGLVVKKDVSLTLTDAGTKKPVTDASVELAGMTAKSDKDGKVKFQHVPVGPQTAKVTKKYYKDFSVTINVWVFNSTVPDQLSLKATGRQVPLKVTNKITGKPIEGATVTAGDATTITDYKGEAVLVVAPDVSPLDATVKANKYNDSKVKLIVTEADDDSHAIGLTPTGQIYFLSKRTGKINVMKSDLDGSNAEVVLAGTGKEDESDTVLLASRDWKYLALKSLRDGADPKLYLIDTTNGDKLSVIDEGDVSFDLLGWVDHYFTYKVTHTETGATAKNGYQTIKSFSAETKKISTLDSTQIVTVTVGSGAFGQSYNSGPFLLANEIIFAKNWQIVSGGGGVTSGMKSGAYSVKADGTDKKTIVDNVGVESFYSIVPYGPNEAYVLQAGSVNFPTYEYESGTLTPKKLTEGQVFGYKNTYLQSPSSKATFWSEPRDGKNVLLVGDADGENGQEIGSIDYQQYGWYTDDYLLVSKNGSELFIMANTKDAVPLKVTDYHKPAYNYSYYGGGYGGF